MGRPQYLSPYDQYYRLEYQGTGAGGSALVSKTMREGDPDKARSLFSTGIVQLLAVFIGYSNGTAPIVSYHYGAENHGELKNMLKRSIVITGIFAVCMFGPAELLAQPLAGIFVSYDAELMTMPTRAFRVYSFSFLAAKKKRYHY